jgi:MFS family permease
LLIDTKGLGLLSASSFYAFALTQVPIGLLLDKIGPRSMMTTLSAMGIKNLCLSVQIRVPKT